jgi:hypothetical protein
MPITVLCMTLLHREDEVTYQDQEKESAAQHVSFVFGIIGFSSGKYYAILKIKVDEVSNFPPCAAPKR